MRFCRKIGASLADDHGNSQRAQIFPSWREIFVPLCLGGELLNNLLFLLHHSGNGIHYLLQSIFVYQRFQPYLHILRLYLFFNFLFPLFVSEGIIDAPLNTQWLFLWRVVFTHVAFERESGIGLFESVPGGAGSPAEVALVVFLPVNHIFVPAHTFGYGILPRVDRKIDVSKWIINHPDTRPRRIIAAISGVSVKSRANHLACPTTIAFGKINLDCLDFLLNFHFL